MELRACNQPWMEMQLRHDGVSSFCCYHYDIPFANLSFDDIWNSPYFRRTREEIVKGDPKGTRCDLCPFTKYNDKPKFLEIPEFITGQRRSNWEQALKHFHKGDVILESVPIKYYLSFGLACNLRCKMCDHPQRFNAGENDFLDPSFLLAQDRYLSQASEIYVIGGEPFLIPNAVTFIQQVAARKHLHDLGLVVHTNGFFLQRYVKSLSPLQNLTMAVSVDSFGARYEEIRKRANWERLHENLNTFLEHGREQGRNWKVQIVVTVMKSGILGYPELMQWVIDNGMDVHFGAVASHNADARDENVFANPELLRQIPGWDDAMARAIAVLKAGQRDKAAGQLAIFHKDLRGRFERWDAIANRKFGNVQDANAWTPLYQAELPLQFNIYNGTPEAAVETAPGGKLFKPSDKRDHISTQFAGVDPESEGERYVRLVVQWPGGTGSADQMTYEVQDQRCVNLEPIGFSGPDSAGNKITFYRLADVSEKVRLILFSPDQKPRMIPSGVALEALHIMGNTGYAVAG